MPKWVEAVRALVRPAITVALVLAIVGLVIAGAAIPDKFWSLTELVVGWWFISRNGNKANGAG